MGDRQVVEVGDNYSKAFTERIGYIVYGAYNMCAAVVLLNMLIAMMSRSFDIIQVSSLESNHAPAKCETLFLLMTSRYMYKSFVCVDY